MSAQPGTQPSKTVARRSSSVIVAHSSRIVLIIASVLPLGWVVYGFSRPDSSITRPARVTAVHERFSCRECHVQEWQTIKTLISTDQKLAHRAMDQACIQC